jgi:hypothetical protein
LVMPKPLPYDRGRWEKNNWNPDGLEQRFTQLGDLAIPAVWDQERQKEWKARFEQLRVDARNESAGLKLTPSVLADYAREYRIPGVEAFEVIAAYQSENDFAELDAERNRSSAASELDFLIAQRLAIPEADDAEESLKRALGILESDRFLARRRALHDWQRTRLSQGVSPATAADELVALVKEFNRAVTATKGKFRLETVMLMGSLTLVGLGALAGIAPTAFAHLGMGSLAGTQVYSLGSAGAGAILQVARHAMGRRVPEPGAEFAGAMFHQIEQETGWQLRTRATK